MTSAVFSLLEAGCWIHFTLKGRGLQQERHDCQVVNVGIIGAVFKADSQRYLPFRAWAGEARLYMTDIWYSI